MKLLVLGLLLLRVSADDVHVNLHISACSDSEEESMWGLDGEQLHYADFDKKVIVYTQPDFGNPFDCKDCYDEGKQEQVSCQKNAKFMKEAMKDIPLVSEAPGAPLVYPKDYVQPGQKNTLVCQASGFYPAPVRFFWTKDQQNVSYTSVSQAYPQSDGTFTQFSRLDVVPEEGQVYSCSLEHPTLGRGQRKTRIWAVQLPAPGLWPTVFFAVGVTLGLVGVAVGTFFLVKGREYR